MSKNIIVNTQEDMVATNLLVGDHMILTEEYTQSKHVEILTLKQNWYNVIYTFGKVSSCGTIEDIYLVSLSGDHLSPINGFFGTEVSSNESFSEGSNFFHECYTRHYKHGVACRIKKDLLFIDAQEMLIYYKNKYTLKVTCDSKFFIDEEGVAFKIIGDIEYPVEKEEHANDLFPSFEKLKKLIAAKPSEYAKMDKTLIKENHKELYNHLEQANKPVYVSKEGDFTAYLLGGYKDEFEYVISGNISDKDISLYETLAKCVYEEKIRYIDSALTIEGKQKHADVRILRETEQLIDIVHTYGKMEGYLKIDGLYAIL